VTLPQRLSGRLGRVDEEGNWWRDGGDEPYLRAIDAQYFIDRAINPAELAPFSVWSSPTKQLVKELLRFKRYTGPRGFFIGSYRYPRSYHRDELPYGYEFRPEIPWQGTKVFRPSAAADLPSPAPMVSPLTDFERRWGKPEHLHIIAEGWAKGWHLEQMGNAVACCAGAMSLHDSRKRHQNQGFVLAAEWDRLVRLAVEGGVKEIVVCFDADVDTNDQVREWAQRLTGALRSTYRFERVTLLRTPPIEGDPKAGIDDVVAHAIREGLEDPYLAITQALERRAEIADALPPESLLPAIEHLNDAFALDWLEREARTSLRWCSEGRSWHSWDGRRWEQQAKGDDAAALRIVEQKLIPAILAKAQEQKSDEAVKLWERFYDKVCGLAYGIQLARRLRARLSVSERDFDPIPQANGRSRAPGLLNTPSGVVDLLTGNLRQPSPEDMFTRITRTPYQPGARSEALDGYLLAVVQGDETMLEWLQRACGYLACSAHTEQIFIVLVGAAGTGKTTFAQLLGFVLGDYARGCSAGTFTSGRFDDDDGARPSPDLVALQGARVALIEEMPTNRRLHRQRLTAFTGGGSLSIRGLHESSRDLRPTAKLLWTANELPATSGSGLDGALWRRLVAVPFEHRPDSFDRELEARLRAPGAAEAMLAWVVEGAKRWAEQGLTPLPPRVAARITQEQHDSDDLLSWFEENLQRGPATDACRLLLRETYEAFLADVGISRQTCSQRRFCAALRKWSGGTRGAQVRAVSRFGDRDRWFLGARQTEEWAGVTDQVWS
jgi:putative DNA primase/helicase